MPKFSLNIDPMPAIRQGAKARITERYNQMAAQAAHTDGAYARKKTIAAAVLAGGTAPDDFREEAQLSGITVQALAQQVQSKPDTVGEREIARQRLMARIDQAPGEAEVKAIEAGK